MKLGEQVHSKNVKQVLRSYPASIGSKNWPEIMRLADKDLDAALELAARGEVNKNVAARNAVARRMRLARAPLFVRLNDAEKEIRTLFSNEANAMYEFVLRHGDSIGKIPRINMRVRLMGMVVKKELKRIIYALIKDSAKMGFKNAGEALLPIFKDNRESFKGAEENLYTDRLLFEAKLSVSLNATLASRDPRAKTSTAKWSKKQSQVIRNIAKKNLAGQTFSERVVDLSSRAEADLRRIIASKISQGESPFSIAKTVKKYVAPYNADVDAQVGPGLYKNPFSNAMRIARTETNRAYAKASAEFAKGKTWLKGLMVTLSPAHEDEDVCDDWAGKILSPEEFEDVVPFHPHCMCYGTYIFKDDVLAGGEEE
jgi:hypothetical protein